MKLHFVSGGCGFVGRHLTRALLDSGASVFVVDNLSTGHAPERWLNAAGHGGAKEPWRRVDQQTLAGGGTREVWQHPAGNQLIFLRQNVLDALLGQLHAWGTEEAGARAQGPGEDAPPQDLPGGGRWPAFGDVFHLASIVGGRNKIENDPLHVGVDLAIDALFFRWLTAVPGAAERVLYASSSAAYPISLQQERGHVALAEPMLDMGAGTLGQPDMTYGYSKMTGEYLAHVAAKHYGLHVACVRPFSGYGEDQETVYPVPAIAQRVAAGERPVTVWGTGEQGRDFVHIDDCIRAMLLAIARIGDGSAVNIGTGQLTNFLELAGLFLRLAGRPNDGVRPLVDKPVGVSSRYADPSLMQKRLGFVPRISLEQGMQRVLRAAEQRVHKKKPSPTAGATRGHAAVAP